MQVMNNVGLESTSLVPLVYGTFPSTDGANNSDLYIEELCTPNMDQGQQLHEPNRKAQEKIPSSSFPHQDETHFQENRSSDLPTMNDVAGAHASALLD